MRKDRVIILVVFNSSTVKLQQLLEKQGIEEPFLATMLKQIPIKIEKKSQTSTKISTNH